MSEVREINQIRRKRRRRKVIKRLIIVAVLFTIGTVIFFFGSELTPEKLSQWIQGTVQSTDKNESFPRGLPSGEIKDIAGLGLNLVLTTDTNTYIYGAGGKILRNIQHKLSNVHSVVAGDRVLLYERGGLNAQLENKSKKVWQLKMENVIVTGDICKSGEVVLVTESTRYASDLLVYNSSGAVVLFRWSPSDEIILTAGLSEDGKYLAVSTVSTTGGQFISTVYLFKTDREKPLFQKQMPETLVLSTAFKDGGVVEVISDVCTVTYDSNGNVLGSFDYEDKLSFYTSRPRKQSVLLFTDINSPNIKHLVVLGLDGKQVGQALLTGQVRDISSDGTRILILTNSSLLTYAMDGNLLLEKKLDSEGNKVEQLGDIAYLLTADQIDKIEVK